LAAEGSQPKKTQFVTENFCVGLDPSANLTLFPLKMQRSTSNPQVCAEKRAPPPVNELL
jgi:hypothetical protein